MTERVLRLLGKRRPKIGYISEAANSDRHPFMVKRDYYAGIGAELSVYFDEDSLLQEQAALFTCDGIHLSGGNTFSFLYWLRCRGMIPALRQYVGDGGVLIGVSAGSILMTPRVTSAALCGDIPDPRLADDAALGLVDFHFWPHFDPNLAVDPQAHAIAASLGKLYACQGGAGIVVDGSEVHLFGPVAQIHSPL